MRELVYYVGVSLDGRISGPGDDYSALLIEGDHMPALLTEYTDTLPTPVLDALGMTSTAERFDTVLMGWKTYAVGLREGVASPYRHLRQYVFSHANRHVPDDVSLRDDPVAVARALKGEAAGAAIWLCGGGTLASALADEIDRLILKVYPVVLGDGVPLFAGSSAPRGFRLVSTRRFESGVQLHDYVRG